MNRLIQYNVVITILCVVLFYPFASLQGFAAQHQSQDQYALNQDVKNKPMLFDFSFSEVHLTQALQQVARRGNLRVLIKDDLIYSNEKITVDLKNVNLREAFDQLLAHTNLTFTIEGNGYVVIVPKEEKTELQVQTGTIKGRVTDSRNGDPLTGATVYIESINRGVLPDVDGYYQLEGIPAGEYTIVASFLGYRRISREIIVVAGEELEINFELVPASTTLQEVEIVSTGYQDIPRERATGSFVSLSEEVLNRRVSTNILDRIEDITPGLIFNRSAETNDPISIRGRSTINANARPLIVVDNFPYDGELDNINPNDVERITILKDAAAASIWGAQAANGVIVITTKKGHFDVTPTFSFTSNTTIGEKPDLFYEPRMSVSSFIDMEIALFNAGRFTARENSATLPYLSEVVETLIAHRDGKITTDQLNAKISHLRNQDIRRERLKYLYQQSINQQYAFNIRGGSNTQRYIVTAGYDYNEPNLIGEKTNRFTLNGSHSWRLFNDRLEVTTGISFVRTESKWDQAQSVTSSYYRPYTQFADEHGNPLPVYGWGNLRHTFVDGQEENGLLNWLYYPLLEMGIEERSIKVDDYRINTGLKYTILSNLNINILYQYWQNSNLGEFHRPMESFYMRDLINRYIQVGPNGQLTFPIPRAGLLDLNIGNAYSHQLRGQVNYNTDWNDRNQFVALAGWELKQLERVGRNARYYGYDAKYGTSVNVDYLTRFPQYYRNLTTSLIPGSGTSHTGLTENYVSFYTNVSYTLDNKYTATASARNDASNLFGVRTNQKWSPLWSIGASWLISGESFYALNRWLPYLKARATYGFNGNIDRSVSAYTTAFRSAPFYGSFPQLSGLTNVSDISNPPNPDLTWEKVQNINLGIEFEAMDGFLNGSIEGYWKTSVDLIGDINMPAQTGVFSFRGNFADMKTNGVDIHFNTRNINRAFKWNTSFLLSFVKNEVTSYDREGGVSSYVQPFVTPLRGFPLHSHYAYEWAGLHPQTGEPMGYLNGEPSTNYTAIVQSYTPNTLIHIGSARPTRFGSVQNTFYWNNISLSANITYRLGYFINRSSVHYGRLLDNHLPTHSDFERRWQNPGDELHTDVPSMPSNFILPPNRVVFELYNTSRYEKGDHIRLQDVRFGYSLPNRLSSRLSMRNLELYLYTNNLGVLWKATKYDIDPDYQTMKPPRTLSFGIKANL